ncbi:MAG TPA: hypothetical protein VIB79_21125 [Candidatus Binatia bacterium]
MKDKEEPRSDTAMHALTNVLNAISTTVQLQEHYLAQRPEQLHELLVETTKDLKHAVDRLHALLERSRELLNKNISTD